jgi:serine/threonine protein kinase
VVSSGQGGVDLGIEGIADAVAVGRGSFGSVYRAAQVAYRRTVAVKVLAAPLVDDASRRSFERECQALGPLSDHPHIVSLYAAGVSANDLPYLIMEFLPGGSLGDRIARAPVGWQETVAVGIKVAGALATAHAAGVLHRDIKPENVLLSAYNEPQLADFGVAKLREGTRTTEGAFTGSVAHAAPEVLSGLPATEASDVWSLASTVATVMAGTTPFHRDGDESLRPMLMRIMTAPPADLHPLGVPDEVCVVIEAALAKDSWERTPTAAAFGHALQEAQRKLGAAPTPMALAPAPGSDPESAPDAAASITTAPAPEAAAERASAEGSEFMTRRRAAVGPGAPERPAAPPETRQDGPARGPAGDSEPRTDKRRIVILLSATAAVLASLLFVVSRSPGKSRNATPARPPIGLGSTSPPAPTAITAPDLSVFVDDFSNPASGWAPDANQDDNGKGAYQADGYHVTALKSLPPLNTFSVGSPYRTTMTSMSVMVDATFTTGAATDGAGVRCDRGDRTGLRYTFEIHRDGTWVIFKIDAQGPSALQQGSSPAILTGPSTNTISAECREVAGDSTRLVMTVNGVSLGTTTDRHAPGPIAWHGALVVYRNAQSPGTEVRFNSFRTLRGSP